MKTRHASLIVAAAAAVAMTALQGAQAQGSSIQDSDRASRMEHKFEKAERYYAECKGVEQGDFESIRPHLKAFTDAEVMADAMADPARLAALMQVVSDPRTLHVMMKCSTEPVMWDTWMRGLTDFDKLTRAAARFADPGMYMRWMMAPMNPAVWTPMYAMVGTENYGRWMTALANPMFYQPMFAMMDPNWYTPRLQWMTDPASFQPMTAMFQFPVAAPAATPLK